MASRKKNYALRSVREAEKLKESLREKLWSQPVSRAQFISSSVGAGHGMRLVISRPLR
jgi:hypothetical protein